MNKINPTNHKKKKNCNNSDSTHLIYDVPSCNQFSNQNQSDART